MRGDVQWVMRRLVGTKSTGVLRQGGPRGVRNLYAFGGRAVAATSSRAEETLREAFSARMRIPRRELRDLAPDSNDAAGLREAAVALGLPAEAADDLLHEHVLSLGATMISSGSGGFVWEEGGPLAPPYLLEGPPLEEVFLAAAGRDPEFEWARPLLAGCEAVLVPAPGAREVDVPIGLPFRAACAELGGSEEQARRLWGLLLLGRLRFAAPGEAVEADEERGELREEERVARRLKRRGIADRAAEDAAYSLRYEKPRS